MKWDPVARPEPGPSWSVQARQRGRIRNSFEVNRQRRSVFGLPVIRPESVPSVEKTSHNDKTRAISHNPFLDSFRIAGDPARM